jgi:hypothetical protein
MTVYRVTVMVTLDVEEDNENRAAGLAIDQVRDVVGDCGQTGRRMWVTGLAKDFGEELLFEQSRR